MTISGLKQYWVDEPDYHKHIKDTFTEMVNDDPQLNAHRTFIENNVYGMGERAFQWFWKIMVDEMPDGFKFLEIGVHKAQILSLIGLLANRTEKKCTVYGITPMDGTGTGWTEDDYEGDIARIHDKFGLEQPELCRRLSFHTDAVRFGAFNKPFDILYIDGDHTYDAAKFDLNAYCPYVKQGGYMVMDDAACDTSQNFGEFQGIEEVCDALNKYMFEHGEKWEFQFNVVHLMVYKRI